MYVNIWVMYIYEGMDFCGKDTLCFRNRESLMEISWPYRCYLSVSGHSIRRTPELERMFGMLHVGRDIRTTTEVVVSITVPARPRMKICCGGISGFSAYQRRGVEMEMKPLTTHLCMMEELLLASKNEGRSGAFENT
jgi:hypothetical protein